MILFCASRQNMDKSLYVSCPFSSKPPTAILNPIGNPAKYLAELDCYEDKQSG